MKIFNKANFDTIILIVIIMILIGIVYLMKKRSTNNKAFHEIPIEENVLTSKVFPKNPLPKNISTSKVFHDTLLAENVSISSEEKEIDVQDLLKFEKESESPTTPVVMVTV